MVDVFEECMECAGNIEMNDSGDIEIVINIHVYFFVKCESMECAGNIEMNNSGDIEIVINTHVHFCQLLPG